MRKILLCSCKMSVVGVGPLGGGLLGGFNRSILLGSSISENALDFILLFIPLFFFFFKRVGQSMRLQSGGIFHNINILKEKEKGK